MHIHILGICGTFMAGIARIAKQLGHTVSGCDANIYPPMSTQLEQEGIRLIEGFDAKQLQPLPDVVIVGNAMRRGNPCVEFLLNKKLPLVSGPQWLYENVLAGRSVFAVAGTHGKTTTTSMLTWILEYAGLAPNFLIGGIPENFGVSARFTGSPYFVIEADEYDTAFFDKRAKFIHYRPDTLILNNLEFDHADIYTSLADIQRQFQYLLRIMSEESLIIARKNDPNIEQVLAKESRTPVEFFGLENTADWQIKNLTEDASQFEAFYHHESQGATHWSLYGNHNLCNAIAAIAAAHRIGIPTSTSLAALSAFKNVKRRLELIGNINNIFVYDDFAHHPTAITATIEALRGKVGNARILSVLECGSYTMRTGVHQDSLAQALSPTDHAFLLKPKQSEWDLAASMSQATIPYSIFNEVDLIVESLVKEARPGDQILIMSNSSFGGIYQKLLTALEKNAGIF